MLILREIEQDITTKLAFAEQQLTTQAPENLGPTIRDSMNIYIPPGSGLDVYNAKRDDVVKRLQAAYDTTQTTTSIAGKTTDSQKTAKDLTWDLDNEENNQSRTLLPPQNIKKPDTPTQPEAEQTSRLEKKREKTAEKDSNEALPPTDNILKREAGQHNQTDTWQRLRLTERACRQSCFTKCRTCTDPY